MQHFNEAAIPQALFHRLEQIGFVKPTPIQAKAIPVALEGNDILGSAQTGTGKTAAFGIPLITHLLNNEQGNGLVLLPTRELAGQVLKALQQFIGRSNIQTALLIGGEDMGKQLRKLKTRPRLIVGTPGRINDHLIRGTLKLAETNFLVLDEVDRMLDMGFGVQLDAIAKHLTGDRQTLMFSATVPSSIQKISGKYLTNPVRISVGSSHAPAANVKQDHVKLADKEKFPRLLQELETRQGSILVFVKTKRGADNMSKKLRKLGHQTDALHGDLRQNKRNTVIAGFRSQKYRILIATDVAARGLDIPHIEHVINHDMPQSPEDYIHRVGRTARAGAQGEAINFISPADGSKWYAIQKLLNPGAKIERVAGPKKARGGSRGRKKPYNGKSFAGNPRAESSRDEPRGEKQNSFKPRNGKPHSSKPHSSKPHSGKPHSNEPGAEKPRSSKPKSGKPVGGKPVGGKPTSGKPKQRWTSKRKRAA